ncbi:MAG: HlyD family efflux transporter periplasmic adaptor subunit [Planctomycetota bacterium]|jgi:multidrug efflux pump subunit AcrA (membrane-fusion protein)
MSRVDLDALRIEQAEVTEAPRPPLAPRVLFGLLVLLAAAIGLSFLMPLLRPARVVQTARVRAAGQSADVARVGVAEAAGWIEPEPFPIGVRPLVAGVMRELLVLEGMPVKKDKTVIARLESAELLARRDRAAAMLKLREAEVARAEADHSVALSLLKQKGGPRLALAEARQALVRHDANIQKLERDLEVAEADRDAKTAEVEGQRRLLAAGGSYPVALATAEAHLRAAHARAESVNTDLKRLRDERAEVRERRDIAQELSDDPRGLKGDLARMAAELKKKMAQHDAAQVEFDIAARELGWCEVKAPIDGVVMKLHAAPGDTVGPSGKEIVALYVPSKLQARIDVPLASIGGVRRGQQVEVRSEVAPRSVTRGVVLRIQRESDLLKNTTQVKVRLIDPDPLLIPETLCRARFLAPKAEEGGAPETVPLFLVPRGAVREGRVHLFDPAEGGVARAVDVEIVGDAERDVVVRGALSVTQRVILDAVKAGERVKESSE